MIAITSQQRIAELEKLRYQYLLDGNYVAFANLCHPQLSYVHSSGKLDDFAGYTSKCLNGFYQYDNVDLKIERVDIFDNVATVFSDLQSDFLAGGERKQLHNKVLSVWVQADGEWKFFAYQPTVIVS